MAWLLLPSGTMNNEFARAVLVNKAKKKPFVHRTVIGKESTDENIVQKSKHVGT